MKKIAVIYYSTYGATKKYAQWLAEELDGYLFDRKEVNAQKLADFDVIVYGGGIYAGGIGGASFITKNWKALKNKKIVVFSCGLNNPSDEEVLKNLKALIKKTFSGEMQEKIAFFHVRGSCEYSKLSFFHRFMMNMLAKMISKKDEAKRTVQEKTLLENHGKDVDFTNKTSIAPIVEFVKKS